MSIRHVKPFNSFVTSKHLWLGMDTIQLLRNLIFWPIAYGYNDYNKLSFWLRNQNLIKSYKKFRWLWKSEMRLQIVSRNLTVTLYTPQVFSLVDKMFWINWNSWREWIKNNTCNLLYSLTAGRCGFKPNETKSFIAADTTIRAGLWLIYRNFKKLTPVRLHLLGAKSKINLYFNRVKLIHNFFSVDDTTPMPFNGCALLHLPRKRFRYHEYNVKKFALFVKRGQYRGI